ncbi:glycosyltransferase family 39 protein [Streptomyces sp. NBC_01763]|uniref:glycosyltransferase family 39 protein n=1 Tax=Streptomyces sp. NBC_01763 TaxID=2975934 RepID=UPI002DDAB601|nr:glycosyltransferase family 39 protein [Streptomyces sp. NBC_01763]WSC37317.1 glycosyltransferase 87 family protein [Streptomyces sp. NBC_01763]
MGIRTWCDAWNVRRARAVVLVVAAIGLLVRMLIAANTPGPADVRIFQGFAKAVSIYGPVRIYEQPLPGLPVYNHPPLAGWMLLGLNELDELGIPFGTLIRSPASIADFFCTLIVFEIVRRRRSLRTAVGCGIGVALSPLLIATSGYHGNTDAVAVAFALAAAYLLTDRRSPLAAGVAAALSISVKFVPVVVIPALFVVALRAGRPVFVRFTAGFTALVALVWGPALVTVPENLNENVLEYTGGSYRLWGLVRFADVLGLPESFIAFIRGEGHFLFVLICVAVGVWLAWVRPAQLPGAVAVTMGLLLLLSTASGLQYLTWAAAAMFVIGFWEGVAYSCLLGWTAILGYQGRSAVRWSETVLQLGTAGWFVLAICLVSGVRRILAAPPDGPPSSPAEPASVTAPRTSHPFGSAVN